MKYVGSKNRISKYLKPIIESYITKETIAYIEPFVGGANMIDKIEFKNKIGSDIHYELIELLNFMKKGDFSELPTIITEDEYNKVKNNKEIYLGWYVGLVGFCATFSSKFFGGYARYKNRDMSNEAIRNIIKQSPNLSDISFYCKSYSDYDVKNIKNCVIYCDPPYKNTLKYSKVSIDYNNFL